jgi:hypothetical protein
MYKLFANWQMDKIHIRYTKWDGILKGFVTSYCGSNWLLVAGCWQITALRELWVSEQNSKNQIFKYIKPAASR